MTTPIPEDSVLKGLHFQAGRGARGISISFPDLSFEEFEAVFSDDAACAILGTLMVKLGLDDG